MLIAAAVVLASGMAVAFTVASEGDSGQPDASRSMSAEDVEIEAITMENVRISNLTVDLDEFSGVAPHLRTSFASTLGENVEGFEADSVEPGTIESAEVTVEDDVATIDAEVETITIEGVEADHVTFEDHHSRAVMAHEMFSGGALSAESTTVEGLSVGTLRIEAAAQPAEAGTPTGIETATETEAAIATETPAGTETAIETEAPIATETPAGTETPTETDEAEEAAVSFDEQTSPGTTVTVDSVTVPEGGFVTIHDSSLLDGDALESVVGVSEHLEPGTHEDVTVTLYDVSGASFDQSELEEEETLIAMPHLDTNDDEEYGFVETEGSEDGAYTDDGGAVTDDATVCPEDDEGTETATETEADG
ncbi:hypothetical protein HUG12_06680 [Halorarum salinum]|uniref:DUF7282 domain-containing protein n=1 Tax=Halorarum salinum TaxID=2743089 RepID=A0A7D5Q908_9EURY|nr:hypothetical protein HUG12_06680 [Halobaculum salinum]